MPRMLDLECSKCGEIFRDLFVMRVPPRIVHFGSDENPCMGEMEQVFLPRARHAQWSDRDAVVVFRKPDGSISYPGRNDVRTPPGCERVMMRSLQEVNRFERDNKVCCEAMHFNSGNGMPSIDRLPIPTERERLDAFMRAHRG